MISRFKPNARYHGLSFGIIGTLLSLCLAVTACILWPIPLTFAISIPLAITCSIVMSFFGLWLFPSHSKLESSVELGEEQHPQKIRQDIARMLTNIKQAMTDVATQSLYDSPHLLSTGHHIDKASAKGWTKGAKPFQYLTDPRSRQVTSTNAIRFNPLFLEVIEIIDRARDISSDTLDLDKIDFPALDKLLVCADSKKPLKNPVLLDDGRTVEVDLPTWRSWNKTRHPYKIKACGYRDFELRGIIEDLTHLKSLKETYQTSKVESIRSSLMAETTSTRLTRTKIHKSVLDPISALDETTHQSMEKLFKALHENDCFDDIESDRFDNPHIIPTGYSFTWQEGKPLQACLTVAHLEDKDFKYDPVTGEVIDYETQSGNNYKCPYTNKPFLLRHARPNIFLQALLQFIQEGAESKEGVTLELLQRLKSHLSDSAGNLIEFPIHLEDGSVVNAESEKVWDALKIKQAQSETPFSKHFPDLRSRELIEKLQAAGLYDVLAKIDAKETLNQSTAELHGRFFGGDQAPRGSVSASADEALRHSP